jgi:hypothetical protein
MARCSVKAQGQLLPSPTVAGWLDLDYVELGRTRSAYATLAGTFGLIELTLTISCTACVLRSPWERCAANNLAAVTALHKDEPRGGCLHFLRQKELSGNSDTTVQALISIRCLYMHFPLFCLLVRSLRKKTVNSKAAGT